MSKNNLKKAEEKKEVKSSANDFSFKKHPTSEGVTTKTVVEMLFKSALPPEGISLGQMAKRVSILNKMSEVHADSTIVSLNESESKEILESFNKSKWHHQDMFILEVAQDFGFKLSE
jgi:hypothetical protein